MDKRGGDSYRLRLAKLLYPARVIADTAQYLLCVLSQFRRRVGWRLGAARTHRRGQNPVVAIAVQGDCLNALPLGDERVIERLRDIVDGRGGDLDRKSVV